MNPFSFLFLPTTFFLLPLLLLTPLTLSSPTPAAVKHPRDGTWTDDDDHHHHAECISDADAAHLVDVLVSLSVKFNPAYVTQYLVDDFSIQSDSLNWVFGLPAGAVFASDKNTILAGAYNLTQSEPQPPIVVSFVMHSCTDIAYRSTTVEPTPVQGIHIARARKEDNMWKAYLSWDEFNSAADLYALGVTGCKSPLAAT